jgi:hypothetical protein
MLIQQICVPEPTDKSLWVLQLFAMAELLIWQQRAICTYSIRGLGEKNGRLKLS